MNKKFFALLLLVFPVVALGHLDGYTDTSIQIASPGVKIVFTLPITELEGLALVQPAAASSSNREPSARAPEHYLPRVAAGWRVASRHRNCFAAAQNARAIRDLDAYQYVMQFNCPQGVDDVRIEYSLFPEQWRGHQNFVRVYMADQRMRTRFAFDKNTLSIPVASLLDEWHRELPRDFDSADLNRHYNPLTGADQVDLQTELVRWNSSDWAADPEFIWLGVKHILGGADHLLFVVALLLVPMSGRRLLLMVTFFTLAHSITLSLSYLGLIRISPAITEPLIAFTVLLIGVENILLLHMREPRLAWRAPLVFAFGLIHGVGLSYQLSEFAAGEFIAGRLLYFNIGVELGQLLVIALLLLPLRLISRLGHSRPVFVSGSALITAMGGFWALQRLLL